MDIKVTATVEQVRYYKDQWGIIVCSIDHILKGELQTDKSRTVFKGNMPNPRVGNIYNISANYINDPKWGGQYEVEAMFTELVLDDDDETGKKKFLLSIFTPLQVDNMYEALNDPYKALKDNLSSELVKVKGCGIKTADVWIRRFNENINASRLFVELKEYELSNNMISKLLKRYISPDIIIEKIRNNPYILCNEVEGIGWKKADEIALKGGIDEFGEIRISAFIQYYLNNCGENGYSWIEPDQLLGALLDYFGEELPDENITTAIQYLDKKLWWNEEKTKIGLRKYFDIENRVATELIRIRDAESNISCEEWENRIKNLEEKQGWEYTQEQINAIKKALKTNVLLIQGSAGTGKSSTVSGILEVLKDYSHTMCALSGRASARLTEVTGEEGFTIHRLLGYPRGTPEYQLFKYNQDNKLLFDIYIVDEISMVDAKLFYYLLRAIPDGAKLICLGDQGQLESIGSGNIAHDMLFSDEIESVLLTKIHRQAAKSAIILESIKIRNSQQIIGKNWTGHEIRGELQDFEITCYSDKSNTFYEIMKKFSELQSKPDFNIMETQIIVPIKSRGDACTQNINNTIQELVNPSKRNKIERTQFLNGVPYVLREGDKVMNIANNYETNPPIYNGNIGVLKKFTTNEEDEEIMVVDFLGIGKVEIPKDYWHNIELGYACTVHKMQGSEFDYVIFGIDFNSYSLLTHELIYTGITRAKKKCYMICQSNALRFGTVQHGTLNKQTHLQQCLYDIAHPKLVF